MLYDYAILTFAYVPAEDCIRLMYGRTSEFGSLVMPGWSDNIEVDDYWMWMRLNWTEDDVNRTVEEFRTLKDEIAKLAKEKDREGIRDLIKKHEGTENPFPMLLRSAERLGRLLEINAHPLVINKEAGDFAQTLVVAHFSTSIEKFNTFEEAMKALEYEAEKYEN